jgi:DUF2075 family protein
MRVYASNKTKFLYHVSNNTIGDEILSAFEQIVGHTVAINERRAWENSMMYMKNILEDPDIPADAGVDIEYTLPLTRRRVDFIITGEDAGGSEAAILVELKQWSEATLTDKDGVVITYVGGREDEHPHPSYQAWSYAATLQNFSRVVEEDNIQLKPCAYLHNYDQDDVITNDFYAEYLRLAPAFLRRDALKLREFIKQYIKHGNKKNTLYRIDHGKIRPSKMLANTMASMLKGNKEFIMIDDQKIVYETALKLARDSDEENKNVLIVRGGPGTGKSVVAINLLVELLKEQKNTTYVTRNAAPRAVYEALLTKSFKKSHISNLFSGSGAFTEIEPNTFDALLVDEAHRLSEKSGVFQNKGENQMKELISATKFSVFFIDEDQRVTIRDVGEAEQIKLWASREHAEVHELELSSQFRCNGSDGYLAWLDNVLQIRETANIDLVGANYDLQVIESPAELREIIFEKNKLNNKSRLVAGYCWNWTKDTAAGPANDIVIGDDFAMPWNLARDAMRWIIRSDSVGEVGCIHTCQGLEMEYVGVVIGPDLVVRDGKIISDPTKRAKTDKSMHGYQKILREEPERARYLADAIIKNTYRTLMTRGQKGCYIYCTDPETQKYFASIAGRATSLSL